MADELNGIVQRMIDAGEPEESIASVIKAYKPTGPPGVLSMSHTGSEPISDVSGKPDEPSTWMGGFTKSIKDQVLGATVGNPGLQAAAHPQTTGDFLSLVLPSGVPNMPWGNFGKEIKAGVQEAGSYKEMPGSVLGRLVEWAKGGKAADARRFNARPLYDQMGQMPTQSPLETVGRSVGPSGVQRGINDMPLAKQMDMLPTTSPMLDSRVGTPPNRVSAGDVLNTTPYSQQPLYKQMEQIPSDIRVAENPRSMNAPKNDITGMDRTPELAESHRLFDELIAKGYEKSTAARISGYDTTPAGRLVETMFQQIKANGGR